VSLPVERYSDDFQIGIRSILAHKLRSALTMLGVIFGVAAVVSMLAIAGGARVEAIEQIRLLGSNNIRVNHLTLTGEARELALRAGSEGLQTRDLELVAANLPNLAGAAPIRFIDAPVHRGNRESTGRVVATNSDYARVTDFHPAAGRFIGPLDVREGKRVAVIGSDVRHELFGYLNPIGHTLRIRDVVFRVVGVMERRTLREGRRSVIQVRNVNSDVYIPISTASARLPSADREDAVAELALKVSREEGIVPTASIVQRLLRMAHRGIEDFEVVIPAELLARAQSTQRVFNIVMVSIAAISLLVGGIGIMNVMLTTVAERTQEIGIRRAVGATEGRILAQFLIETVLVSVLGGAAGIALGFGMAKGISLFAGWQTVLSPLSVALAFGISALVGIVFGIYPARRAARMNPITALRFE
jgi:putative ABC transport system permease protein